MEIILNKEDFSNGIKIVEKISAQKTNQTNQPILSNILIKTISSDRVLFCATDLKLAINYKTSAQVVSEGSVTLDAKRISDIASRISSTEINIKTNEDDNGVKIKSGRADFDLISLNPEEFPKVLEDIKDEDFKTIVIDKNDFSKAIKQVIFAVSQQETQAVLTGVCFNIEESSLELAATDGNRLTRVKKEIKSKAEEPMNFVVPAKTLQEIQRISALVNDENVTLKISKNKILFNFENMAFQSRLLEGIYPKYQQLIPTSNDKKIIADRVELINSIERVAVVINDRTLAEKFNLKQGRLEIMANTSEAEKSKDYIDVEYDSSDDMLIAFNYKYVLDALKNIDSEKIVIEISDVLAASIFKPYDDKEDYICLIMPIKVQ